MASDGRLRRFLHLERARPDRADTGTRSGESETEERIAGVERPREPDSDRLREPDNDRPREPVNERQRQPGARPAPRRPPTGAQLERFGPEPEPVLELVETDGRRAFIRCHRCGGDNNVFATACAGCGVSLDTPEQHDFDERFWTARQAEAEREAVVERERAELRRRAEAEEAQELRAAAEQLARDVGQGERRRLAWMGDRRGGPWQPLGLRLVRRLVRDERWHPAALGLAAGLAAILLGWGLHLESAPVALAGAVALVLLLVHAPW